MLRLGNLQGITRKNHSENHPATNQNLWAERTMGLVDGLGKHRQHKGKQNADDGNHQQHFHEGKCAVQFEAA